jgi:SHS2 domain-containing protein
MHPVSGYREIAHTADWELEAWAPDLAGLLVQAALGMAALAGVRLQTSPRLSRTMELQADDSESLLVGFLSDVLWLGENEGLGFDRYQLTIDGLHLAANLEGAPLASIDKEIKAVTWHRLEIRQTEQGLNVRIVFDV